MNNYNRVNGQDSVGADARDVTLETEEWGQKRISVWYNKNITRSFYDWKNWNLGE
jgi:hypothetical protein